MSGFLLYIVCFVLKVSGAISFLIYGDLVICVSGQKRGLKRGASSLVVWLGVLAVAVGEGRQAVEAALAAACVVEVDVVGDGLSEGVVVVELVKVVHFAFRVPQKASMGPLSMHMPGRDMLWSMPWSRSLILNLVLVY